MEKPKRNVISFELTDEELDALRGDAKSHGSRSHHQRAREIIIDHLSNREMAEMSENLAIVEANVGYLMVLARRIAFSVIVHAARKPSEEANEWIRKHMPDPNY